MRRESFNRALWIISSSFCGNYPATFPMDSVIISSSPLYSISPIPSPILLSFLFYTIYPTFRRSNPSHLTISPTVSIYTILALKKVFYCFFFIEFFFNVLTKLFLRNSVDFVCPTYKPIKSLCLIPQRGDEKYLFVALDSSGKLSFLHIFRDLATSKEGLIAQNVEPSTCQIISIGEYVFWYQSSTTSFKGLSVITLNQQVPILSFFLPFLFLSILNRFYSFPLSYRITFLPQKKLPFPFSFFLLPSICIYFLFGHYHLILFLHLAFHLLDLSPFSSFTTIYPSLSFSRFSFTEYNQGLIGFFPFLFQ